MRLENKQIESDCPDFTGEQLFTPNEAAVKLKVTPEQIRSLIRKGQLSAVNVGTGTKRPLYRITQQALDDFLNHRYQPTLTIHKKKFKRLAQVQDFFPGLK
jgi:excisionase family DNA binding protein